MTTLAVRAADRKTGMTLAEVAAWVDQARAVGLADTTSVTADVGLRGQLTAIGTR